LVNEDEGTRLLYAPLLPIPRVLILGAGLDAVPLVNVLAELGWRVAIADHRPAYLERPGFARAEWKRVVRPAALGEELVLGDYDAIVVMSHHLPTDRAYLSQLAAIDLPYLGLLGPPARKLRLLEELGPAAGVLAQRLRGPVGLDIGADSAESIALSIAAEIQQVLARDAGSDSRRRA
jgi:xanthine/CO dehydrogenase XdhC/CoxF family maturation factor